MMSAELTLGVLGAVATYSGILFVVYSVKTKIENTATETEKNNQILEGLAAQMDRLLDTSTEVHDEVELSQQLLRTNNELIKDNTRAFQSLESAINAFNTTVAIIGRRDA